MAALIMTPSQAKALADSLYRIAKEIEDTAHGSSRVAMYQTLASELRQQAQDLTMRIR